MFGLLLLSQIWPLEPSVVLMGTKTLDCDNAGKIISDMIFLSISLLLIYFRSVVIVIAVGPKIETCCLDSIFGAQYRN